jgi:hypothetical protein
MSDTEPNQSPSAKNRLTVIAGMDADWRERPSAFSAQKDATAIIAFNRLELRVIFDVYGARVAAGDWRDYALDFTASRAVFSIFRRACETPLYRIEKNPSLARRQGAYSVTDASGLILRRGQDLPQVLSVLNRKLRLVGAE